MTNKDFQPLMKPRTDVWPVMCRCRQRVFEASLSDTQVNTSVVEQFYLTGLDRIIKANNTIAITCGSRGIDRIALVLATLVEQIRKIGANPIVFPAMGSHGGATAQGQVEVLESIGVTEATINCPIWSSMDVVEIGQTDSAIPVYLDQVAWKCDGIICVNRIKPHTHFRGRVESGLCKMLAIGAGKHAQAAAIHRYGLSGLRDHMPQVASVILKKAKVLAGFALLENGRHELYKVTGIHNNSSEQWIDEEALLLEEARGHMPSLPVKNLDLLIVNEIGKDISGSGMDTNVIGRCRLPDLHAFPLPQITAIAVLNLTNATHGNAFGIGLADITTTRVTSAFNPISTYRNAITAFSPSMGAIPITAGNDREAIRVALDYLIGPLEISDARVIRIRNTSDLSTIEVSQPIIRAIASPNSIEMLGETFTMRFERDDLAPIG